MDAIKVKTCRRFWRTCVDHEIRASAAGEMAQSNNITRLGELDPHQRPIYGTIDAGLSHIPVVVSPSSEACEAVSDL